MDSTRGGFRDRIDGVRFLPTHPYLDHARIVLDELAHGFPAQAPDAGEFADAIVPLKWGWVLHEMLLSLIRGWPYPRQKQPCAIVGQRARCPTIADRKSTRLNSSHLGISYA